MIANGKTVGTVSVPAGKRLNGVLNGTLTLGPTQAATVTRDASGNFVITTPPIPRVFSSQAVYINSSTALVPGVYDIDTTGGPITVTLEAGGILGDNYWFRDIYGAWGANNMTLNPGSNTADFTVADVPWADFVITYKSGNWSQA